MNATELRRLSELRSLLEGFAARHAAQHIAGAPAELNCLRSILEQLTKALQVRAYVSFREADFELHQTIVKLATVPRLKSAWREAWDGLLSFHAQGFDDYFPDARVLAQEHDYLVEAIALPIARIASRVGYHDVSRFGQHFKRHHGYTPSEWRKR
jgi:DNA-binding GntR family transcriptional regulator